MALAITSFTPTTASGAGGTQVTITGTQLDTADVFLVGGKQAQVVGTVTPTTAVIRVPAQAAGTPKIFAVDNDTSTEVGSATLLTVTAAPPTARGALTGAAKWGVRVDTSVAQDGSAWTALQALTNVVPALDQTTQDTSNYADYDPITGLAWKSQAPTQLGWSLALTFDRSTFSGVYDPAQEVIRAAAEAGRGAALVHCQWFDRTGGPEAYEGFATANWAEQGGDTSAKSTVQSTLMGSGPRLKITNPAA